jgi:hypothetical protein
MSELLETMRGALRAHNGCAATCASAACAYVSSTVSVNVDGNSPGLPASLSCTYAPKRSMMANRSAALSEASPGAFPDGGVAMLGEDGS